MAPHEVVRWYFLMLPTLFWPLQMLDLDSKKVDMVHYLALLQSQHHVVSRIDNAVNACLQEILQMCQKEFPRFFLNHVLPQDEDTESYIQGIMHRLSALNNIWRHKALTYTWRELNVALVDMGKRLLPIVDTFKTQEEWRVEWSANGVDLFWSCVDHGHAGLVHCFHAS